MNTEKNNKGLSTNDVPGLGGVGFTILERNGTKNQEGEGDKTM